MTRLIPFGALLCATVSACSPLPAPARVAGYREVPEANGSLLRSLSCSGDISVCYARAEQLCPEGYDVVGESAPALGGVGYRLWSVPGTLAVRCARDEPATLERCGRVWESRENAAVVWASWRGASPRETVPAGSFWRVCGTLDPRVQRCLDPEYHARHEGACDARFGALSDAQSALVDVVFVAP
jgi:hypothetical protein